MSQTKKYGVAYTTRCAPSNATPTRSALASAIPATDQNAAIPARHSPRRERRRRETTAPLMRYVISTDCACFTGNLAAVFGGSARSNSTAVSADVIGENFESHELAPCARRSENSSVQESKGGLQVQNIFRTHRPGPHLAADCRRDALVTVPRRELPTIRVGTGRWGSGGVRKQIRGLSQRFR